jgi:hypothetical protein
MLQWADTFNRYGTNAALLLNGAWIENHGGGVLVADPDPTSTAKVYQAAVGFADQPVGFGLRYALSSSQPTVGMAGKLWMTSIPQNNSDLCPGFDWRDVSNNIICRITVNAVGGIAAYNAAGTKLGETTAPVLTANAYNHIEAKAFRNAATGTIEIRVNGQAAPAPFPLTGLNLGAVDFAQVMIGGYHAGSGPFPGPGMTPYWKEVIIWDGTGTYNKDFMGTCAVIDIDTDSDVVLGWTPNSGTVGWSILDNNPPTDDAAYIGAATAALTNTFGLKDLPPDVTTVRGGVIINRSRKIDGGDGNVQMGIISGAATGLGADRPITVAYTYWKDVFEVDPNTGVPFTPANFNLAKLKMTRTV